MRTSKDITAPRPLGRRALSERRRFLPSLEVLEGRDVPAPIVTSTLANAAIGPNQPNSQTVTVSDSAPANSLQWNVNFGTQAYLLDQQLGFADTSNYMMNFYGSQEKWIQDSGGNWYFLLPNGQLHSWDHSQSASGPLVATLDPIDYWNPSWLTDAANASSPTYYQRGVDQAFAVDAALSLQDPNTTTGLWQNYLGKNEQERWVHGTDTSGMSAWFYILPNGNLYEWNSANPGHDWLTSYLDPMYYQVDMLRNLTHAVQTENASGLPVTVSFATSSTNNYSNTLNVTPANYRGTFWAQAVVSDGSGTGYSNMYQVTATEHAPALNTPGTFTMSSGTTGHFNLTGSDPDTGDTLTYQIGFVPSSLNSSVLEWNSGQVPPLTYEPQWDNYGGNGTRWFLSGSGQWYFLDQQNDFFQWTSGTSWATGKFLGLMPSQYQLDPMFLQNDSNATVPAGATIVVSSTGQVTVTMPNGFGGDNFAVIASLSDGMTTTAQRFVISVT